uniref:Uncharacterized protein n=1 Tax=Haptolina ericina TaxID=156174 RepID=A0A7S3BID6_9EUKA|mmetsp:Transcript_61/g.127  ORF Transcript_61/g.127 Transcript_61/m.127 type:complete len:120 (+) Transcript_61:214-573(+)|eukprot:CAMPEP_0181209432 /NCGR_PEP_ID=MMETSP1096-20121128/22666_1 /TAXON_ID=156174 ORGANISM="Chrysochromulina ericina, Strain CCMP281" /NCGR_SAMPLE_ID=MMETSP1096 /ASSEMBLY_ACC=CAM_ASM_000453 /LENGTH=119 /DNA_ID=CAMNT_0023300599 /DNA_START=152 /DNA_END=511 /DNA_ORIENTATION=+
MLSSLAPRTQHMEAARPNRGQTWLSPNRSSALNGLGSAAGRLDAKGLAPPPVAKGLLLAVPAAGRAAALDANGLLTPPVANGLLLAASSEEAEGSVAANGLHGALELRPTSGDRLFLAG